MFSDLDSKAVPYEFKVKIRSALNHSFLLVGDRVKFKIRTIVHMLLVFVF
jgi:hypothetical protein